MQDFYQEEETNNPFKIPINIAEKLLPFRAVFASLLEFGEHQLQKLNKNSLLSKNTIQLEPLILFLRTGFGVPRSSGREPLSSKLMQEPIINRDRSNVD